MAVKTRAELKAENASDFPDNATRLISPADLRGQMDDIVDSALFPEDGLEGIPGPPGPAGPPGETGITASSVHYTNVAAVAGVSIGVGVNLIETLSYATPADGAGGIYRRVAGPADIQSGDGAWWELVPQGPMRVAALGVVGDAISTPIPGTWSGTDAEPKIKDALYRHIYAYKGAGVELPIGRFMLNRGIHVGYGDGPRYGRLRGAGRGFNGDGWASSTLVWNFTDESGLSIQCGRAIEIADIGLYGPGVKYQEDNGIGQIGYAGVADDTLLATWVDPAWPAQASSRYAPAAAIAIDPRSGTADPTNHYRDVDYPVGSGITGQYSRGPSSGIVIRDFEIRGGGMVAVVVHPNFSDGNGDFVRLYNGLIQEVPIGLSIGQTQARLTLMESIDFNKHHTAITINTHGKQQGVFAEARNCHFSGIQIFNFNDTSVGGHITINGYGEEMWRIGDVTTTSAVATKMVLHQLKLSFDLQTTNRGVPATMIGGGGNLMPLEINGGSWTNYIGCAVIDKAVTGVSIEGLLMNVATPTTHQEMCFLNGTAGGLVFPQLGIYLPIENIHPKFVPWNLDTFVAGAIRIIGNCWPSDRTICTPLWVQRHGAEVRRDEGVFIPERVEAVIAGSTFTGAVFSGLTLTTTWAGRTDTDYMIRGPLPGDILYHTASRSVFVCMTANTTTDVVTFKLLNNYRGTTPRNPIDLATDTLCYLASLRWYSPASPIYGIITSGSAIITDAGSVPHGGGTQVATAIDPDIAVNDYLIVDPSLAPYLSQTLCKVTAIDETAKTITLSGNAIGSSTTRVRFGTFVRPGVS